MSSPRDPSPGENFPRGETAAAPATPGGIIEALEDSHRRADALLAITSALGSLLNREEAVTVVVEKLHEVFEARVTTIYLFDGAKTLHLVAHRGLTSEMAARWGALELGGDSPVGEAARERESVWTNDSEATLSRFPTVASIHEVIAQATAALPLLVGGSLLGVLSLAFQEVHRFEPDERNFLETVAGQCAQALERSRLYEAQVTARKEAERFAELLAAEQKSAHLLSEVGDRLSRSLDYRETLDAVCRMVVPRLADWSAIDVLDYRGGIERVGVHHSDPEKVALAHEFHRRYPTRIDDEGGTAGVLKTGEPELTEELPPELIISAIPDPEKRALVQELDLRSILIVPLIARGRTLGVLTLVYAESDRRFSKADVPYAMEIARRAALYLDNARLFSEAQELSRALDSAPLFIAYVDHEHRYRWANSLYERWLGVDRGTLEGRLMRAVLGEERYAASREALDRALSGELVSYEVELPYEGETRWMRVTHVPRQGTGGGIEGLILMVQDIEERKRHEAERMRQLEVEQQLVGIVSHDLRNPLSAISMNAKLLERDVELAAPSRKKLSSILLSAERATRLIQDLLDFTQARLGGRIPVRPTACDLAAIADQAIEEIRSAHPEREIERRGDRSCEGLWDSDRLAQVIANLVTNALTYGRPESPVTVTTRQDATEAILEVHNEGPPIPEAVVRTLFLPLSRGSSKGEGRRNLGLGLYIVDQLVRAHRGSVELSSTVEGGTTFRVRLPRSPD